MNSSSAVVLCPAVPHAGGVGGAADIQTITHGREVDLQAHLVPGKYVLFDFYADWCGPCRALEPQLQDLAGRHAEKLALRKVDIINWDSPVTRQYRISSIPYMVLYGPDGDRITAGDPGSVMNRLHPISARGAVSPPAAGAAFHGARARRRRDLRGRGGAVVRRAVDHPGRCGAGPRALALPPVDTAADPATPPSGLLSSRGSLDGPFTRAQLGELVRRRRLNANATARRRGDASWNRSKMSLTEGRTVRGNRSAAGSCSSVPVWRSPPPGSAPVIFSPPCSPEPSFGRPCSGSSSSEPGSSSP